ncbi:MAG TPA: peptidylprolyl isomerase [Holophagaceae bacterium]|nr:peptidylprolyl isomerase [Holophagaceae bacterium]
MPSIHCMGRAALGFAGLLSSAPGLLAQAPAFGPREAIRAEWSRTAPAFTEADRARLSPADRARLDLTLRRIGQPGLPDLLPPELAAPTEATWLEKAQGARTPQERVTALAFLNRLKSPRALSALEGLSAGDAKTWPRFLSLQGAVATARLNGGTPSPEVAAFLAAVEAGPAADPVRTQAARLRLVLAGKEGKLLPPVPFNAGHALALLDAWNRSPWEARQATHGSLRRLFERSDEGRRARAALGLATPRTAFGLEKQVGALGRWLEGYPDGQVDLAALRTLDPRTLEAMGQPFLSTYGQALAKCADPGAGALTQKVLALATRPSTRAALLPALLKHAPEQGEALRRALLKGEDALARAEALGSLEAAPPEAELTALTARIWKDTDFESQQTLLHRLTTWKLPDDVKRARLRPWLQHPDWACRLEAFRGLAKLDPATPWPQAPATTAEDEALLQEAERLALAGKPVRLRLTFEGPRVVVLALDPTVAPINVANLVRLARKGFFDGHRVPRVVPDFVVQMGSPFDSMSGGPGYSVRCEDSLDWYGPGSVGMALAGKDTGGCQFFITTNATPHLTGKYTRVGRVEWPDYVLPMLDDLTVGIRLLRAEVLGRNPSR